MTRPIAVLDPCTDARPAHAHPSLREEVEPVDAYDLPDLELDRYAGLLIAGMVDQELLQRHRERLVGFLGLGRVVVFCGHLHRGWLPGCRRFVPSRITSFRHYAVRLPEDRHAVLAGVEADDLTYRRGVAGFFARGHHPPPPGAQVLARLWRGEPTTWLDTGTTRGAVLVHAGIDLLRYAGEDSTAARVPTQLLSWIRAWEQGR